MAPTATMTPAAFHILLALARDRMHGLGIAEEVDEATRGAVRLGPGTLYRSLKELVSEGAIEEVDAPAGEEDSRRRFYAITERGRERVRREAAHLERIVDVARARRVLPDTP